MMESLPTFTKPARERWESIPADIRQRLLSNVWCGHCRHETTITNFSGTIKGDDLLLVDSLTWPPSRRSRATAAPNGCKRRISVVEQINTLIEQRCALTIRRLTDPAADNDAAAEPSV